ncbi:MAG: DUF3800 domain-containing protein [Verrucomicrobia bacterium]|nr:DUF3800 domain-containing protein [Verrucomicrobiota bacterium]
MGSETWAFIDEYGNPNLATEKEGVSQFFIVSAVIVDRSELDDVRDKLEVVRRTHFQTGKMKSQKLGDNRSRWLRVLGSLSAIPFKFYALVVDKRIICKSGGLQWTPSFYKNLCGRIYGKLMKAYPSLHVRADPYGDDKFKESFARYIEVNHRPTLFDRGTFEFIKGEEDVAVQLPDILCGVLARCYDPDMLLRAPHELLQVVADRALLIDEWPPRFRVTGGRSELSGNADARIAEYSLQSAEEFILTHEGDPDENVQCQVAVLERLVLERRLGADRHLPHGALIDHLRDRGLAAKGETWFRMSIVAPLRVQGVLLTSSQSGYKLPTCPADVASFVQHAEIVCVPMLQRVLAACDAVKLATEGEVDVLASPEQAVVNALIQALDAQRPCSD